MLGDVQADPIVDFARDPDLAPSQAYQVSRAVNSVKNDNEECIEPIGEPKFDPISGAS